MPARRRRPPPESKKLEVLLEAVDNTCYYCERFFTDRQILIDHQKQKHLRCLTCNKRLSTANGLRVHMLQVHKETLERIENAMETREDPSIEIFGDQGVPQPIKDMWRERVTEEFFRRQAESAADYGHTKPGPPQPNPNKRRRTDAVPETSEQRKARVEAHIAKVRAEKAARAARAANGSNANEPSSDADTPNATKTDDEAANAMPTEVTSSPPPDAQQTTTTNNNAAASLTSLPTEQTTNQPTMDAPASNDDSLIENNEKTASPRRTSLPEVSPALGLPQRPSFDPPAYNSEQMASLHGPHEFRSNNGLPAGGLQHPLPANPVSSGGGGYSAYGMPTGSYASGATFHGAPYGAASYNGAHWPTGTASYGTPNPAKFNGGYVQSNQAYGASHSPAGFHAPYGPARPYGAPIPPSISYAPNNAPGTYNATNFPHGGPTAQHGAHVPTGSASGPRFPYSIRGVTVDADAVDELIEDGFDRARAASFAKAMEHVAPEARRASLQEHRRNFPSATPPARFAIKSTAEVQDYFAGEWWNGYPTVNLQNVYKTPRTSKNKASGLREHRTFDDLSYLDEEMADGTNETVGFPVAPEEFETMRPDRHHLPAHMQIASESDILEFANPDA